MSQLAVPSIAKYSFNQPTRPMLARDADSMYWMARYVERAEHIARVMWVNSNLLMDVGDLAPALQARQWESILTIFHVTDPPSGDGSLGIQMMSLMTFSASNPNSIC